ncbi:membrane progestin receptor delta isoform X1 [Panthera leo]|uniref:membrane progestin receptor delta isoform X1 n=1 Tax=Panthera leo TaxID=9689 RepID=UPI001C6A7531|nr:membrane progestin receptor delta isoform X1 [Panthera leo]XP_042780994.1 membrane progestin receptor delta isoform X1 [Panthera leo]XP_042780995.1 membrane progestin receptor delta isoform X1 [Panthera leo]
MLSLKLPQLLRIHQVPRVFWEDGIMSGYRRPSSSARDCVLSSFQMTNETVNIWTHFLPTWYFLWRLLALAGGPGFRAEPYHRPLLVFLLPACLYPFASCCAHTFSSMSPRARHICYFLDYGALSLYSLGCAFPYAAYSMPASWLHGRLHQLFVPAAALNSFLCTGLSCYSRFPELESPRLSKILRTAAFAYPFLFDNLPLFYRVSGPGARTSPEPLPKAVPTSSALPLPAWPVLGPGPQLRAGGAELQPHLPPALRAAHRLPFRLAPARAAGPRALRLHRPQPPAVPHLRGAGHPLPAGGGAGGHGVSPRLAGRAGAPLGPGGHAGHAGPGGGREPAHHCRLHDLPISGPQHVPPAAGWPAGAGNEGQTAMSLPWGKAEARPPSPPHAGEEPGRGTSEPGAESDRGEGAQERRAGGRGCWP